MEVPLEIFYATCLLVSVVGVLGAVGTLCLRAHHSRRRRLRERPRERPRPAVGPPKPRSDAERDLAQVHAYLADLEREAAALPTDHHNQAGLDGLRRAAEARIPELERRIDDERFRGLAERWEGVERQA